MGSEAGVFQEAERIHRKESRDLDQELVRGIHTVGAVEEEVGKRSDLDGRAELQEEG